PPGYGYGRSCITAACTRDEDCNAEPGGACALIPLGCCGYRVGSAATRGAEQIVCVYPSDGCQQDEDCATGQYCLLVNGRTQCSTSCP
ncbi:MAG: hypothetical protein ABW217_04360, partial [Polyangiaceae bacterium]